MISQPMKSDWSAVALSTAVCEHFVLKWNENEMKNSKNDLQYDVVHESCFLK